MSTYIPFTDYPGTWNGYCLNYVEGRSLVTPTKTSFLLKVWHTAAHINNSLAHWFRAGITIIRISIFTQRKQ